MKQSKPASKPTPAPKEDQFKQLVKQNPEKVAELLREFLKGKE